MDGELEYLIKAWKRVWESLHNAEAVGAITVEDAKTSVQRLQEETLGARNCGISGSCVDGREPTQNWKKTRFAGRELPQIVGAVGDSLWIWMDAGHVGELQQHHQSWTSVSHWIKWECWNILAALHRRLICN
jgi:hypothetical protein